MKKSFLLISISLVISLLLPLSIIGQNNVTSRLRVVSGGTVTFYFSSLTKYKTGLILTDWTRLHVYFNDTILGGSSNPIGHGWRLLVRADDNGLIADGGSPALSLSSIILTTSIGFTVPVAPAPVTLSALDQILVQDDSPIVDVNEEITISYAIGTTNDPPNSPYLGKPADYYTVNLVFTLEPLP